MKRLLLLLLLGTFAHCVPGQPSHLKANWEAGEKWHYQMIWSLDSPALAEKRQARPEMNAFPSFEVLQVNENGYTLKVTCDSLRMNESISKNGDRIFLLPYRLEYIFTTDKVGRYLGIQNSDDLARQMQRELKKYFGKSDAESMYRELIQMPEWQEAFFQRDYAFLFYFNGLDTESDMGKTPRLYYELGNVPAPIGGYDTLSSHDTKFTRSQSIEWASDKAVAQVKFDFTQAPYKGYLSDKKTFTVDRLERNGYVQFDGQFDRGSGRLIQGDLIVKSSGGSSTVNHVELDFPTEIPEMAYTERRSFWSLPMANQNTGSPKQPGIKTPDFPSFDKIVHAFFGQYKGSSVPKPMFQKKKEGYFVIRLNDNMEPVFEPELFWSYKQGSFLPIQNFHKPAPPDLSDSERHQVEEVYNSTDPRKYAKRYLVAHRYDQANFDRMPYYGYPGWYVDITTLLEPSIDQLNPEQLQILARSYSAHATALLSDSQLPFVEPGHTFELPPGQNALSANQLLSFRQIQGKGVDAYKRLMAQAPDFETPIGPVRTKYANEVMDGFLKILFHQSEEEARQQLKPGLYDPYILQAARNMLGSCPENAILITNGDTDTYPLLYVQAQSGIRTDVMVVNSSLLLLPRYYAAIKSGVLGAKPLRTLLPPSFFEVSLYTKVDKEALTMPYKDFFNALGALDQTESSPDFETVTIPASGLVMAHASPTTSFDGEKIKGATFKFPRSVLPPNQLALFDIIAANHWERPLCFALTCGRNVWAPFKDHLILEGIVKRVYPDEIPEKEPEVNVPLSLELWSGQFEFVTDVPITERDKRPLYLTQLQAGVLLAMQLFAQEKKEACQSMLSKIDGSFPDDLVARGQIWTEVVRLYAAMGMSAEAEKLGLQIIRNFKTGRVSATDREFEALVYSRLRHYARTYKLENLRKGI